jgi:cysteine desulfurase
MRPYQSGIFANPSSLHQEGVRAREAVHDARKRVAAVLSVKARDVFFTAGGTESVNLALLGTLRAAQKTMPAGETPHLIISAVEHAAVQAAATILEAEGCRVTTVPVRESGALDMAALTAALTEETVLVAVMYANNEIGTVQPVREVSNVLAAYKTKLGRDTQAYPYLYTDASQAPNYCSVQAEKLGVDMLTLDGSKIYGPKGIGILYKKPQVIVEPLIYGGKQEGGMRAGTENVPGIVGFAEALDDAASSRERDAASVRLLADTLYEALRARLPDIIRNGTHHEQLPNIVNICVPGLHAEFAVLKLDARGIACTATTACKTNDETGESYVVRALGRPQCAASSLRFSLGRHTTKRQVIRAAAIIAEVLEGLSDRS